MERSIEVRDAADHDAPGLAAILNAIIARGGTTAYRTPFTPDRFLSKFMRGDRLLLCLAAHGRSGELFGFQHLARHPDLPPDWGDIATFARSDPKVRGVGRALFEETARRARSLRLSTINATIRADNEEGLGYYDAVGFRTYRTADAVPLADGTRVGRVSKRLDLER